MSEYYILEPNTETTKEVDINSPEAQALLSKYGFNKHQPTQEPEKININPNKELTLDEMIALQDNKKRNEKYKLEQMRLDAFNKAQYGMDVKYIDNIYNDGLEMTVVSDIPIGPIKRY